MFLGRIARGTERALLLSGAWDMDDLERRYRVVHRRVRHVRGRAARAALDARQAFTMRDAHAAHVPRFPVRRSRAARVARAGASARAEAVVTFDAIYDALAEPATQHFAEVALGEAPPLEQALPRVS